jgi:hypothetical protein
VLVCGVIVVVDEDPVDDEPVEDDPKPESSSE